jgi:hypothetical protein
VRTVAAARCGVRAGQSCGATDGHCCNIAEDPVHVRALQAIIPHLLGINHERLTYKYQGRQFRLTDVHGRVVSDILA